MKRVIDFFVKKIGTSELCKFKQGSQKAIAFWDKGAAAGKAKPYFCIKIRRAKRLAATW